MFNNILLVDRRHSTPLGCFLNSYSTNEYLFENMADGQYNEIKHIIKLSINFLVFFMMSDF